jgi:transposase-like protein
MINIENFVHSLTTEQKTQLLSILKQKKSFETISNLEESRFSSGLFCPKCGCTEKIIKKGFSVKKQRYLCHNCSSIFTSTTDSFLSSTKKSLDVWKKYIHCMINSYSLSKSAEECHISIRTSFMWRHKILDSLRKSDKTELKGVIEADETFFRLSYKGRKDKNFVYQNERKPRRRGGECSQRGLSQQQVCVPCVIERETKSSISMIGGLGKTSIKTIENVLSNRIKEKSVICTDKEKSYIKFSKSRNLEHIRLEDVKSKIKVYHIQTINSFHSRLKNFMRNFNGVSTKHLNNYLTWNNIIHENSSRNSESFTIDKTWSQVLKNVGYTLYKDVCSRPSIPV